MAQTSSPYGIEVVSDHTGIVRPLRMPNGIQSGLASNIFKNQAVTINPATGTLIPVTNPGGVPQPIFGIFQGVEYTPVGGRPAVSPFWASGTTYSPYAPGAQGVNMFVYVIPAWLPGLRFKIQADGSVAQALMGSQFNITNAANGNTTTGLSACTVGAAGIAAGGNGQFALIEFATDVAVGGGGESAPGDAYTDLICTIALSQIGPAPQPSIG